MKKTYPVVLCIAGSDSCSGAGLQADIKSVSANGAYAATVTTALTAQNTIGVQAIHSIPVNFIEAQLSSIFTDINVQAIKIGMLYKSSIVNTVAKYLKSQANIPVILDPVMVAQTGDQLIEEKTISTIKSQLLPQTTLLTPNIPEAVILSSQKIYDKTSMQQAAKTISEKHHVNTLIKGGHLRYGDAIDYLYLFKQKQFVTFKHTRINTENNHGTGCTLSSAIAAYIAQGYSIESAIEKAKSYIHQALLTGQDYILGKGHGPVNHFFMLEDKNDF